MTQVTRTAKDVVRVAFDALNDRDRDTFIDLHAEDAVMHSSDGDVRGVEAIAEEEFGLFDTFSDLTYVMDTIVAEDDLVAARWTAAGTHDGDLAGIGPTEQQVDFEVMGLFRVEDALVTEVWVLPDRLGLMRQLGVVEAPPV